jgi:hydrogenase expression/formation protein HypD
MEVCGGQTHTLIRYGIDELLEGKVELIHGPGCPVCATPLEKIDRALAIAHRGDVILASFGDMLRVPGSGEDLLTARSHGADVRIVYSPTDAVALAERHPERQVVFFAVGFETTAPANAMAVWIASKKSLDNFSVLVSHVRVPPAIRAILDDPEGEIEGFIAPGHVCAVMGSSEYDELAREYGVPFVISGFEPLDLLQGLLMLVEAIEDESATAGNQYTRTVRPEGNLEARRRMQEVFETCDMLREAYAAFDAERRFAVERLSAEESPDCIAGAVLKGKAKPSECTAFGRDCTPERPLGAPMVSTEGACAAYFAFRKAGGDG